MGKVLFIANHAGFSKFNAPYFDWFKSKGWTVHNASPGIEVGNVDKQFDVKIDRSPFSIRNNIKAFRQLKEIIEKEKYDLIHVHTPMGSVLGRLASRKVRKRGTKVLYTAHGFHFYKGAPLKNWLLFCPIELLLSHLTDALITINDEDSKFAKRHKLANGNVYSINGIGVNLNRFKRFSDIERSRLRKQFNIDEKCFVCLYTAQFIPRKNHEFLIKSIPDLCKRIPNLLFIFVGNGDTLEYSKDLAHRLGIENNIRFLGGRSDVDVICNLADVHVSSSLQEGLALGNVEAMATGCALVISDIRGHREVCKSNRNGFLFPLSSRDSLINSIVTIFNYPPAMRQLLIKNNIEDSKCFSVDKAMEEMGKIYESLL